jgi:alpha-beta hydrolase superfamily lysophospholipase
MIALVPRPRTITPVVPRETSVHDGLAYTLWLPEADRDVRGGVVILHGAGSCKESHHDYARLLVAARYAAISFDQRGHGASDGPMDGRAIADVCTMADLLRSRIGGPDAPIALRGSSMGGCFALMAASGVGAGAVVAICPAGPRGLQRGVEAGTLGFDADVEALSALLGDADLHDTVGSLEMPVLILHAEGDEQVPVEHSRELAERFALPVSRLITVPGGHHRSVQHDEELQAVSLKFIERALG